MLREVLKFTLRLEEKDLKSMESKLNSRFARVARKFGGGLKRILTGGGVVGAIAAMGSAIVMKVLNPLKETQDAIERTLGRLDNIGTMATKFSTTTGNMAKLITLAEATGISQDELFPLMNKFESAVLQARQDPNKPSAVREFAKDEDIANSFFKFVQALKGLDAGQQGIVQREVFGEKQTLRAADFFQADFPALAKRLGLDKVDTSTKNLLSNQLNPGLDLVQEKKILDAKRNFDDLLDKSKRLSKDQLETIDASARAELKRESERIDNFKQIAEAAESIKRIEYAMEKAATTIFSTFPDIQARLTSVMDKISGALPKIVQSFSDILTVLKGSRTIRGATGEGE